MVRAQQDQIDPPGCVPGAADPDPRRRRVRRPGRRRRVPRDERHRRLPRRRHHPPHHQQPDRLHHGAASTPARRSTAPTWPRRSRRRSSTSTATTPRRASASPSWRASTASVPQGRRHRHGLLPPPRPQRGRRPELHPAADVQGDRRAPQRAQAVRRVAGEARRHHGRGGRAGARRLPRQAAGRARRDPLAGAAEAVKAARPPQAARRAAARRDRRRAAVLDSDLRAAHRLPRGLHVHPKLAPVRGPRQAVRRQGEVDWATAEALAIGSLRARGPSGPARRRRTPAAARSASATPRSIDYETGEPWIPLDALDGAEAHFWVYDSLLSEYAALGFEYGYCARQPGRAGDVGGAVRRLRQRRADHHRPVPRRRRGQVGPAQRPRAAAAARLRGPGPRAQLGAHRALPHARAPRTTSRSSTPPPRRSTSTCCAARCTRERPHAAGRVHARSSACA